MIYDIAGDALFFHSNLLHTSARNDSDMRRWAFLIAYNRASNNPIIKHHHPRYTPLHRVGHVHSYLSYIQRNEHVKYSKHSMGKLFYCYVFQVPDNAIKDCSTAMDMTGKAFLIQRAKDSYNHGGLEVEDQHLL